MLLLLSILLVLGGGSAFKKHCWSSLNNGRQTIERVASALATEEHTRIRELVHKYMDEVQNTQVHDQSALNFHRWMNLDGGISTSSPCPAPNKTIFTTIPASKNIDSSNTATGQRIMQLYVPSLYDSSENSDPFVNWMNTIYEYMINPEAVCDGPTITDLNSITEEQLYGFFSTLAVSHPGPFCSLCDHFVSEIHGRLFYPSAVMLNDDELYLTKLLYAHVPSPKSLCSAIAPGCYENYQSKTRNITESVICLECTACMTVTNIIQHKFLLNKARVQGALSFLKSSIFHNLCAELCVLWRPLNLTLFPQGFTYDGCMRYFEHSYNHIIDVATVILRPERICSLEIGWCELNEVPNIIHCLRELCFESLKDTPQTRWLCSQIPDRPDEADQFLNIQQTKMYKKKKAYHEEYLLRRNEL